MINFLCVHKPLTTQVARGEASHSIRIARCIGNYNNSRKTHCFSCADIRLNEGIVRSAFFAIQYPII